MKIQIDETKLNLLLEEKKTYIGKQVTIDSIISAISFLFSAAIAEYKNYIGIPGAFIKYALVSLGIFFTSLAIYKAYKTQKNQYSYKDLLKDINALNEISRGHSIIIIKDTFNEFSNRFLVYYDNDWKCKLFINYKTNENNEDFIKTHLSNELKINAEDISLKFIKEDLNEKFSQRYKINKFYKHKFYLAEINKFNEIIKKDNFEVDNKKYFWSTISELEKDEDVRNKNLDIVNIVKNNF